MKLFLTNLPSFYKINLYNEIRRHEEIFVVFTDHQEKTRNANFYEGEMNYDHVFLQGNYLSKAIQLSKILFSTPYKELIIGGWDNPMYWVAMLLSSKHKNSVAVESSIMESQTSGVKAWIKRLFLKRIHRAYVSGNPHKRLMEALSFRGDIVITEGVGVFNVREHPVYKPRERVVSFLYVGRLVKVKNLSWLIRIFNNHPELHLDIIGFGEEEISLKAIAGNNISFLGAVDNNMLYDYYQETDVFILPSLSETWGLVVEEALNNGCPVMVSDKVGCYENLVNENTGVVFSLTEKDFEEKLAIITNIEIHNRMRKHISHLDFIQRKNNQVECYLNH